MSIQTLAAHPAVPLVSAVASSIAARAIVVRHPSAVKGQAEEYESRNALLPAGAVFSIWGPIYAGLAGLMIVQALPDYAEDDRMRRVRGWLAITPPLHAAWYASVASGQGSARSLMIIEGMLLGALGLHRAWHADGLSEDSMFRVLRPATGLYAGWLMAANLPAIANTALEAGWSGERPPAQVWGTAGVLAGAAVGAVAAEQLDDPWVEVPFVNALAGIAARQWSQRRYVVAGVSGALAAFGAWRVARALWR